MAPTIIEQRSGDLIHIVAGGSGGSRIFGSIVQTILNVDWGMDISQAIESARVHDQLFPPIVMIESGFKNDEIAGLAGRGHQILVMDINLAVAEVQGIHVTPNGTYFGRSTSPAINPGY
jgi:gamma-glutamyltranspeptidase/glutathione hydrolase/leukotriene-C4 hydrolase